MLFSNLCKRCWGFLFIFCVFAVTILSTSAPTYGLATSYSYGIAGEIGVQGAVEVTYGETGYFTSSYSSSDFNGWSEDSSLVGAFASYTALEEGWVNVALGSYGWILELQTTRVGEYAAGGITLTIISSGGVGWLPIENSISDINYYIDIQFSGMTFPNVQYWEYLGPGQSGFIDVSVSCYSQTYSPPVPEPTTMLLLGSGLIGLAAYGRKKFFKK